MATWFINNRLTTGLNNGTSAANAWQSIYDSAYGTNSGTVTSNDTVQFVAGSGPYREAFHATRIARITDVSFSAAGKTITSTATNLSTIASVAGNIIRISGSGKNDGQYTISSASGAGPFVWTLNSTNALQDEAAGATITITNVTNNLGSYALEQKRSAGAGTPITWQMNGVEINSGLDLMTSAYKWTASPAKSGEYYLTRSDGSNPSVQRPDAMVVNGVYWNASAGDANHTFGTVGSLSRDGQPGWGNNDTLGFNTIYIRSASGNPTTLGWTIEKSELTGCIYAGLNNHTWQGGVFKYSNDGAGTFSSGIVTMRGGATGYKFQRCAFLWGGGHGIEHAATAGTQTMTVDHCLFYWCGHRAVYMSGSSAGTATLNVYNCTDWSAHLFALIASTATSTYFLNLYGNISANGEAGAIDKKASAANLSEGFNCWYPRMTAAGGALGYVSTANWAKTAPTDIPANTATTTSTQSSLTDPHFVATSDSAYSSCDFHINTDSLCAGRGPWALGDSFTDFAGNTYTAGAAGVARSLNIGCYQNLVTAGPNVTTRPIRA